MYVDTGKINDIYQILYISDIKISEIVCMNNSIVFVSHKICPFAERVWLTLEQKKIPYTFRQVSLKNKDPFFTETYHKAFGHDPSSDGKVPILIDGDQVLTESDMVAWYLAEKFNTGTQLIPEQAFDRLRLRFFVQNCGKIIGAFYGFIGYNKKSKEDQDKQLANVNKVFTEIQASLVLPFALGDNFTLADILIYPWFARWCVIEKILGVKIDEKFVKIHQWINNVQARESATKTKQPVEYFEEGYSQYFK